MILKKRKEHFIKCDINNFLKLSIVLIIVFLPPYDLEFYKCKIKKIKWIIYLINLLYLPNQWTHFNLKLCMLTCHSE